MVQSQMSGGATKNTILVVDDSTTMRSMVQSFLPQDEFHVQVAKSGQEGLARIHEHCPDILLLDFIMPGMNGYEVYIQLREQPEYADLPIVIMSGSKVEVFNKFAESKAEQKFVFLSKPFDPETLKKQIALALELQFISTTVEDTVHQEEIREEVPHEKPANSNELVPTGEAVAVSESEPQPIVSLEPEVVVPTEETTLEEEFALHLSNAPVEMPEMSIAQVPQISMEETNIHEPPVEAAQPEHLAEAGDSAPSYELIEVPIAQVPMEEVSFASIPAPILETAHLSEEVYGLPNDELPEIPLAQVPLEVPTQETSLNIPHELPLDVEALISEDTKVPATPSHEPVEVPMAQKPMEEVSLAPIHVSTMEIVHLSNTLHSSTSEAPEIATFQVSFDEVNLHEMSMETALLNETVASLSHEPELPAVEGSPEETSIDEFHELPSETPLDAPTSEEASEISLPVSAEAMSLNYIQQNLAHIIQTETYVMGVLQNLDERVAKDMHSIKNLADQTALLQQEFSHMRGILNNLNDLPKHFEALKEQVLTQPQAYPDESGQGHLLMVGTRLNHVDSTLMQSVVTLDRLEEIQAGIRESLSNSYGQLLDRLTAIERQFEAIVVRSPDPEPVPATPVAKAPMPPLLYITIALGALNFGAVVALLLR